MTDRLGVVVLAAGAGSRMGGVAKCLVECEGVPLLHRLLQAIDALRPAQTILVLGHHADAISRAMQCWPHGAPPSVLRNWQPGESPASSLRLGLSTLLTMSAGVDTVMVLLADLPLMTAGDLSDARLAFDTRSRHQHILWPVHCNIPGHPVILDAAFARAWLSQKSAGLRVWAQQRPDDVALWHPGHDRCTTDLDTPADLARLAQRTGRAWTLPSLENTVR